MSPPREASLASGPDRATGDLASAVAWPSTSQAGPRTANEHASGRARSTVTHLPSNPFYTANLHRQRAPQPPSSIAVDWSMDPSQPGAGARAAHERQNTSTSNASSSSQMPRPGSSLVGRPPQANQSPFSIPVHSTPQPQVPRPFAAVPPSGSLGLSGTPVTSANHPGAIIARSDDHLTGAEPSPKKQKTKASDEGKRSGGGGRKGDKERKTRSRLACFACKSVRTLTRFLDRIDLDLDGERKLTSFFACFPSVRRSKSAMGPVAVSRSHAPAFPAGLTS